MVLQGPSDVVRKASTRSIAWGVLLIILGLGAMAAPMIAAIAVNVAVSWLLVLAGVVHVALAFHTHGAGRSIWRALVGLAYIFFGGYLIMHPLLGVASLTLLLASLFLVEGILNVVMFFKMRSVRGASWMLIDGIITLLLGLMIYVQWPSSSAWVIGTLVGISLFISGLTRILLSLAVRETAVKVTRLAA